MSKLNKIWRYLIPSLFLTGMVVFNYVQPVSAAYLTGGNSQWANNGLDIYYNSGKVGVGMSNPGQKLDVGITSTDYIRSYGGFVGNATANIGGTGAAAYFPSGVYIAGSSSWIYGNIAFSGNLQDNQGAARWKISPTSYSWFNGGNVGIGSTTPVSKLAVNGLIKMPYYTIGAPEDVVNVSYLNATLSAFNTSTNLWRLSGSNLYASSTTWNVGIGVTGPTTKLDVNGNLLVRGAGLSASFGGTSLSPNVGIANQTSYIQVLASSGGAANSGGLIFHNPGISTAALEYRNKDVNNGDFIFKSDDTNYNVGIGTTNPGEKLEVSGNIKASGAIAGQGGTYITSLPWFNCAGSCGTGYVKLVTPIVHNEANMFNIHIIGYDYSGAKGIDSNCYGYAYGSGSLISHGCQSTGNSTYPIEIGVEDRGGTSYVVVRIGGPASNWYFQNFTAEYRGWVPKSASGFSWVSNETTPAQTGNTHNAVIDDKSGTASFAGQVSVATPSAAGHAATKGYVDGAFTAYNNSSNFWKLSGSNLYASSTTWNVGIGTTNPISGFKTNISQDNAWPSDVTAGQLVLSGATAPSKRLVLGYDTTSNLGYIAAGNYGIAWSNLILQPSGGNVGIGITNPGSKLEVNGTVKLGGSAANVLLGLSANVANRSSLTLNSTSGNPADIIFKNGAATTGNYGQWTISSRNGDGGSYRFGVWRGSENGGVAGEKEVLSILPNGNGRVGIGTISPSVALDVSDGTGAVLDVSGGRITSVGNAVTSSDALSLGYAQGLFAPIGGAAAITLKAEDNRQISPSELSASTMKFGFTAYNNNNNSPYADFIHMRSYTDASGGRDNLLMFNKNSLGMRLYQQDFGSTTPYAAYKDVLLSDNSPVINHILKYTSNGTTVSAGKSQIFDNGTNVGIGTVSPTSPGGYTKSLHIQGGYASLILDSTTSAKKYEIGSSGAGGLDFYDGTAGAVRMTINTTGGGNFVGQFAVPTPTANSSAANKGYVDSAFTTYNNSSNYWRLTGNNLYSSSTAWSVGIGTASPGAKLDVVGSILSSGSRPVSIDGSAGNVFIKGDPGGWANGYNFYGSGGTNRGGFGAFGTADALSYYYIGTPYNNPTMTIKPGSGVGIGTTEPSAALQVVGNVTATQFNGSGAGLTGIASSLAAGYVDSPDGDRNANNKLPTTSGRKVRFDFASSWSTGTGGNYAGVMTYAPWDGTTASTGDASYQLAFGSTAINGSGIPQLRIRNGIDSTWNSWRSIILDDGSGNVGIGTTNPAGYKLNVNGIANFTGTVNVATPTANGHAATKAYVDDSFTVYNNSSNYWKLSGSNLYASSTDWNVGIGTTTPGAQLTINKASNPTLRFNIPLGEEGAKSGIIEFFQSNYSPTYPRATIRAERTAAGSNGRLVFATSYNTNLAPEDRMTITESGYVGIGTTNPSSTLSVANALKLTSGGTIYSQDNSSYLDLSSSLAESVKVPKNIYTTGGDITIGGGDLYGGVSGGVAGVWRFSSTYPNYGIFYSDLTNDRLDFSPNGGGASTPVMSVVGDGNVGIGNISPTQKLDVNGNIKLTGGVITNTGSSWISQKTATNVPIKESNSESGGSTYKAFIQSINKDYTYTVGRLANSYMGFFGYNNGETNNTTNFSSYMDNAGNWITSGSLIGNGLNVSGTANFTGTVSVATPTANGHAATKAYVDGIVLTGTSSSAYVRKSGDTMTGDLNMGNKKILGVSKITVGTIDPLYDIKGIKYSTFASAIVGGVKEEYVGQGQIKNCNSQSCFWYLDFDQTKEGSDPWVWRQTIDFRPEKVEVLMTAQGLPTQMSYEFKDNGIIFHSEKPTKFSYRLIGARFDWREWPTKALDQTEKASLTIK